MAQQVRPDMILHNGKGDSKKLSEWAKEIGISLSDMIIRVGKFYHSGNLAKVFAPEQMLTWEGKTQSIKEWAKELRISYTSMSYRVNTSYENPKTRHLVFLR